MSEVRLQVKNLCKSFGITKAVQNVSFNVNKGEVHALIGENGSGKSTLTNMLTGIYSIGSGTFILDGKEIHPKNQVEANNEGVSIIVQELGTLSGLTVAENIFLGHEEQFVHFGIKNTKAMNRKATELLKKYGFDRIKASDIIDNYNFEDRKLVEIVKATYFDPKIVVVDETTTALSQEGRDELYKHMDRIRNSGNSVIFISHDLPEVLEKSDTITILRDGIYIDTVKSADVTEDDLKRLMVGREVTGDYYRADYGEKVSDEVVLSVKNVTVPGIISDISFDLHKGEMLGFGGLSESGMHEVGKAIFGASYDREGTVTLADGTQINDIPTAIKHSIAYTSKDRDNAEDRSKINNATLRNRGWELSVNWQDRLKCGFSYGIGFNISDYKAVVTKYNNPEGLLYNNHTGLARNKGYYEGMDIGEIWGFQADDLFRTNREVDEYLKTVDLSFFKPGDKWQRGDVKYIDSNHDGKVDSGKGTLADHGDLKVIGNATPKYSFGFNLNAGYKGFEVSALFQGVAKRQFPISGAAYFFGGNSYFKEHLDHFNAQNPEGYLPRLTDDKQTLAANTGYNTTRYLLNAAYMRLKNLTVSYSFKPQLVQHIGLSNLRVYVTCDNLFTVSKLPKQFDPETLNQVNGWVGGSNDTAPALTSPLNANGNGRVYPMNRNFVFGIDVTF